MSDVREKYQIRYDNYAICIYHPVTTEPVDLSIFDALEDSLRNYVVIYPNNDPGADRIISRIDTLKGNFKVLPSMRFEHFLTLLKHAEFIIGNSSAGIREAPIYGVPTIDVGSRQDGRYYGSSVVNCRNIQEIKFSIENPPERIKSFHFGTGDSARKFLAALPEVWEINSQKKFIDR
jgi:UDP-N-acetylglucosamine 2-epimerase (hydrolysing)